jgi:hypothetical protein
MAADGFDQEATMVTIGLTGTARTPPITDPSIEAGGSMRCNALAARAPERPDGLISAPLWVPWTPAG